MDALQYSRSHVAISCLVFELSKLKFRAHNSFEGLIYESGVVGVTPEGMGHHIL